MARTAAEPLEEAKAKKSKMKIGNGPLGMFYQLIRVTLITEILGTTAPDPEMFRKYILTKPGTPVFAVEDEPGMLPQRSEEELSDDDKNKATVFLRDSEGCPILRSYQFKAFLRTAGKDMGENPVIKKLVGGDKKAYLNKLILRNVKVFPENIKIANNVEPALFSRPLRASGPSGERVAIASSEYCARGNSFEIVLGVLPNEALPWDLFKELLHYGTIQGLLQWRNAGHGAFKYQDLGEIEYNKYNIEKYGLDNIHLDLEE